MILNLCLTNSDYLQEYSQRVVWRLIHDHGCFRALQIYFLSIFRYGPCYMDLTVITPLFSISDINS